MFHSFVPVFVVMVVIVSLLNLRAFLNIHTISKQMPVEVTIATIKKVPQWSLSKNYKKDKFAMMLNGWVTVEYQDEDGKPAQKSASMLLEGHQPGDVISVYLHPKLRGFVVEERMDITKQRTFLQFLYNIAFAVVLYLFIIR